MTLTIRKVIVLGLIGIIFLLANILVVANWISDTGIAEKASWIRKEFLTGTAIAVILVLLLLLVSPKNANGKAISFSRRCPVCDKRLVGNVSYCGNCGSKVWLTNGLWIPLGYREYFCMLVRPKSVVLLGSQEQIGRGVGVVCNRAEVSFAFCFLFALPSQWMCRQASVRGDRSLTAVLTAKRGHLQRNTADCSWLYLHEEEMKKAL